jgi:capsular exopolysaccharide synthesis family protein
VRAVKAHPLLIGAVVLVAIAVSVAIVKTRAPEYNATAQILVTPVGNDGSYGVLPVVSDNSNDPARTLQTAATIVDSPQAAAGAARAVPGWTTARVGKAVAVQPRGDSDVIAVTATAGSGGEAVRLANAYARSALLVRSTALSRAASSQISALETRLRGLSPTDSQTASQIAGQITTLSAVASGRDPNFSLLQPAVPPATLGGTSAKLIVLLALLAGLVVGVGGATAVEYLSRRVRDEDELLALYPLPVLARVPPLPNAARDVSAPELLPARVREAFRTLQVQLSRGRTSDEGQAVMFTSPSPGDGKTASAVNFALALAAANFRVILFDFDLRKPDLGDRLRIRADFMDFFRTNASLADLLVESRTVPGVRVISARPHGDVTPLLEAVSRRLPDLLREARKLADYVIVDTAPVGQVSDALRVAAAVDDIVLVARPGNTDRTELEHTRELLERMGHTPTGVLVVGSSAAGDAYGAYGIEHGRNGRAIEEAVTPSFANGAGTDPARRRPTG